MAKHPAHQSQKRLLQQAEIYLMSIILYVFVSKLGISDRTQERRSQVDKGITGPVKTVTSAQIPFAWQAEGFVHALYFWANVRRWFPWSFQFPGGTEVFVNANPIFGGLFLWYCHKTGFVAENWMVWGAFLSPWIWFDGWMWVQLFRVMGWGAAIGIVCAVYWLLNNA